MMCSETSPPRLSFSHDLGQAEVLPRTDSSLLDLNGDFEFSISRSFRQDEPSSADELFSHGVIKPMQPRDRSSVEDAPKARQLYSLPPLPSQNPKKESTNKENDDNSQFMDVNSSEDLDQHNTKPHHQSKSFWGFKRSSSLNQDNKKSLLCSLPEFLKRSNSTGSAPNPKRSTIYKDAHAQHKKQSSSSISMSKSSSTSSSSSSSNQYRMLPRPPSKKGHGGASNYGNGVRISPVLNVPSPYISRGTAKLFCLSSFLYPGKEKKQKK